MMSLISLTIWMIIQGAMEGIFFDMRDHRKEYPLNIHYLFGLLRVTILLLVPTLENGIWLVLAYPFFHDGAMYLGQAWSYRKRKGYSTWRVCWVYWFQNPPTENYKGKAIFSFKWPVRVILLIAAIIT